VKATGGIRIELSHPPSGADFVRSAEFCWQSPMPGSFSAFWKDEPNRLFVRVAMKTRPIFWGVVKMEGVVIALIGRFG
jgi:hypothetical protein